MADPKQCVDFVMRQEDAGLTGIISNTPGDAGGTTRFGLTAKWHPELVAQDFYLCAVPGAEGATLAERAIAQVPNVPADRALVMAELAYEQQYTGPLYLAAIASQAIATAMLSFAVVEGQRPAVQMLQAALENLGRSTVTEDGVLGPMTVDTINEVCSVAAAEKALLQNWGELEYQYFEQLAVKNPVQQRFVEGWENRVAALEAMLS